MGDLDTLKHDADIIERVVGGVRDRLANDQPPTHVVDVHTGRSGERHSTLELTVGVDADEAPRPKPSRVRR